MGLTFPPIKADRCVLWITLHADEDARERFAALEAVLKTATPAPARHDRQRGACDRDAAALPRLDAVRAALGPGDRLHLISAQGDRLNVEVIAAPTSRFRQISLPMTGRAAWRSCVARRSIVVL